MAQQWGWIPKPQTNASPNKVALESWGYHNDYVPVCNGRYIAVCDGRYIAVVNQGQAHIKANRPLSEARKVLRLVMTESTINGWRMADVADGRR